MDNDIGWQSQEAMDLDFLTFFNMWDGMEYDQAVAEARKELALERRENATQRIG